MRFTRLFAAVAIAALIIPATAATAFATTPQTWYVDDDGMGSANGCDGSSVPLTPYIQEAIDNANPGDTIMVCPGEYDGQLDITKSLTIRSVQRWAARIEPHPDDVPDTDLVSIHDVSGVVLRGFKILSTTLGNCHIISALVRVDNAPDTVVSGNKIRNPDDGPDGCVYRYGVQVTGDSGGTQVLRNRITDFLTDGVLDTSTGTVTIRRNYVNFFHAVDSPYTNYAVGISAQPASGGVAQIRRNHVISLDSAGDTTPKLAYGIYSNGGEIDVRHNTGHNVQTFINVFDGTSGVVEHNRAVENIDGGLYLTQSSGVEVAHNTVGGATVGVDVDSASTLNNLHDNNWTGPGPSDCYDGSSGSGTSGTGNTWTNNLGGESSPSGICTPAP